MTEVASPPRHCPARPLPPYSYVPGLSPHPTSDPRGHSFGQHEPPPPALAATTYGENQLYRYAVDLFNHGYYWEAHEAWEALWHVAGRRGATADFLKGLIKLAAAGVKLREGRAAGVRQHALRAVELLQTESVRELAVHDRVFGIRPDDLIAPAQIMAAAAEELVGDGTANAKRTLPLTIRPEWRRDSA